MESPFVQTHNLSYAAFSDIVKNKYQKEKFTKKSLFDKFFYFIDDMYDIKVHFNFDKNYKDVCPLLFKLKK